MLTRRNFLKGLLATIAATAITRNGVLRPSDELETPKRTIFDMAQNTWREQQAALVRLVVPGSIVRFSSDCGDLVFPPMVGALVHFATEGGRRPVGMLVDILQEPKGKCAYLVSLNSHELAFAGWRWSQMRY